MAKRKKRPRPGPQEQGAGEGAEPEEADEAAEADEADGGSEGRFDGRFAGGPASAPGESRFGAGSGVLFALLSFLSSSMLAVGEVESTDSAADIAARLVETRGRVTLGVILTLLSLFFLLVFVSYLYSWLRSLEGRSGWLANVAYGGGLLTVASVGVSVLISFSGAALDDYGGSPEVAKMLLLLDERSEVVAIVPLAALMGATALVAARAGDLPRWLTTSGMLLAASLLLLPLPPLLFSTLWLGLLAITLLSRQGPLFRRRRAA